MRAVFDTNVVVSALLYGGHLVWLPPAWTSRRITPVVCRETTIELIRVLDKPKFRLDRHARDEALGSYLPYGEIVILPDPLPVLPAACRDIDDEKFIHLALAAKADYLVTGDEDLLAMRGVAPVEIVTIDQLKTLAVRG